MLRGSRYDSDNIVIDNFVEQKEETHPKAIYESNTNDDRYEIDAVKDQSDTDEDNTTMSMQMDSDTSDIETESRTTGDRNLSHDQLPALAEEPINLTNAKGEQATLYEDAIVRRSQLQGVSVDLPDRDIFPNVRDTPTDEKTTEKH